MFGYLDPGAGSLVISAVVGGAAAAGVAIKQARHRVRSKFSRKRSEEPTTTDEATGGAEPTVEASASDS
ncbi:MAG: hypothetical protein ACLFXM_03090 [Acidimicrobiia bacterium]